MAIAREQSERVIVQAVRVFAQRFERLVMFYFHSKQLRIVMCFYHYYLFLIHEQGLFYILQNN